MNSDQDSESKSVKITAKSIFSLIAFMAICGFGWGIKIFSKNSIVSHEISYDLRSGLIYWVLIISTVAPFVGLGIQHFKSKNASEEAKYGALMGTCMVVLLLAAYGINQADNWLSGKVATSKITEWVDKEVLKEPSYQGIRFRKVSLEYFQSGEWRGTVVFNRGSDTEEVDALVTGKLSGDKYLTEFKVEPPLKLMNSRGL